eukprot:723720-Rhodomonas_salina.2
MKELKGDWRKYEQELDKSEIEVEASGKDIDEFLKCRLVLDTLKLYNAEWKKFTDSDDYIHDYKAGYTWQTMNDEADAFLVLLSSTDEQQPLTAPAQPGTGIAAFNKKVQQGTKKLIKQPKKKLKVKCYNCSKIGHFESDCKQPKDDEKKRKKKLEHRALTTDEESDCTPTPKKRRSALERNPTTLFFALSCPNLCFCRSSRMARG